MYAETFKQFEDFLHSLHGFRGGRYVQLAIDYLIKVINDSTFRSDIIGLVSDLVITS